MKFSLITYINQTHITYKFENTWFCLAKIRTFNILEIMFISRFYVILYMIILVLLKIVLVK